MTRPTTREFQLRIQQIVERMRSQTTASAEDSESAKKERREQARADRLWGLQYYFPHYFDAPFADCHKALLAASRIKGTPTVFAGPRGSGKSTMAQGLEVLSIVLGERHFLVLCSMTEDLAIGHTAFLKLELEENPRLLQDFGELKGNYKWEEGDLITKGGSGPATQARILARGIGQKIRGLRYRQWRPDYFRLDDMEDDISASNPKRSHKALDWITKAVIPAGKEAGLESAILFIGTVISKRSVMDVLLNHPDYASWKRMVFPAIKSNNESYWPEKYPVAKLDSIKRIIGTNAFQSEMQQDPRDEEGDFQEGWIRYYHPAELIGLPLVKTMAIDPSIKETSTACFKAIVTVGMDPEGLIYVLDAFIRRTSINQMVESAYLRYDEFKPRPVGLETVAGQEFLLMEFQRAAARKGYHLPLQRIEQRESKEIRIKGLGPLVELGVIRFQKGHSDQQLLIEQLLSFPSGETDGPDALEMAIRLLRRATAKMEYQVVESRRYVGRSW